MSEPNDEKRSAETSADEQFPAALVSWIKSVIARFTLNDVMVEERSVWEKSSDPGFMVPTTLYIPSWSLRRIVEQYESAEWKAVLSAAAQWPDLSSHLDQSVSGDGMQGARVTINSLVDPFLPVPIWDRQTNSPVLPVFDEAAFIRRFATLRRFLQSDKVTYKTKTILVGLRVDESLLPLRLTNNISLDKLSPDEVQQFGEMDLIQIPYGNPRNLYEWTGFPWIALCWDRELEKRIGGQYSGSSYEATSAQLKRIQEAALASVALLQYGIVVKGGRLTFISDWPFKSFEIAHPQAPQPRIISHAADGIEISSANAQLMVSLFNKIVARNEDDSLSVALRRLVFAMEKNRLEDRFIDGMIATESILGGKDELTYRVSLRIAFALEPTDAVQRKAVFDTIKNAYAVRSAIVHGGIPKAKNLVAFGRSVTLQQFVPVIEDLIRKVVREALLRTEGKFQAEAWDDIVLGTRTTLSP